MLNCPLCNDKYNVIEDLWDHLDEEHNDSIPKDFTPAQYLYSVKTGKTHGSCVICKKDTKWNLATNKYNRFCENPKCKEKYVEEFRKRMIGKYGKISLLDDPEQQKKMLSNRSISGMYEWSDNSEKKSYVGSYELDYLNFVDLFMNFDASDVMMPSPHVYYYMYEGEKKFYIPDSFIISINTEVEIKDGGDNPNMHHKIQDVDKVKEKLKDEVLMSQKEFNYVKITNKNYEPFFKLMLELKNQFMTDKSEPVFIVEENFNNVNNKEIVTENFKPNDIGTILSLRVKMLTTVSSYDNLKSDLIDLVNNSNSIDDINFLKKDIFNMKKYLVSLSANRESSELKYACSKFLIWLDKDLTILINNRIKVINKQVKQVKESNLLTLTESTLLERGLYPVYILLTYTGTTMASLIRSFTKEPYSHASISFSSIMDDLYSFGKRDENSPISFINENITQGIFKDVQDNAVYSLYVTFIFKDQYDLMKERLEEFKKNKDRLKYSILGLFNIAIGKETHKENEYFCSQFVAEILKAGIPSLLGKDSSLYTPYSLTKIKNMYFVDKGKLVNYNAEKVDKKVELLSNSIE